MATIEDIRVCRDLWLGALASGPPNATLVEETLLGCRDAVASLAIQWKGLGYPVREVLPPCPADLDERIARVEARTGVPIPKILREFWRIVGGITLVDLERYRHVAFWDGLGIEGAQGFCDGVHVDRCEKSWEDFVTDEFVSYAEAGDEASFHYSLAPDGYHKDDISGGPPYAIGRGSDWAPSWMNFDWSGYERPATAVPDPPDFVSYLRTALLECAGFPGLFGHPKFQVIRQGILPHLRAF